MKDYIKEAILGVITLALAFIGGKIVFHTAKAIAAKLGMSVWSILFFPIAEIVVIPVFLIGLIILWVAYEDKKLEKELKALEKELESELAEESKSSESKNRSNEKIESNQ